MKRLIFAAVFAAVGEAGAGTTVYRLELTDEKPYIVGQDGVKREVALVDPCEYAMMTGRVQSVWASLNSTRDGRTKLHGKCKSKVDDETKELVETYADGYVFRTPMVEKTRNVVRLIKNDGVSPVKVQKDWRKRPGNVSKLHWEMKQKLQAAKSGKVKEVTVIHDAATGKDVISRPMFDDGVRLNDIHLDKETVEKIKGMK